MSVVTSSAATILMLTVMRRRDGARALPHVLVRLLFRESALSRHRLIVTVVLVGSLWATAPLRSEIVPSETLPPPSGAGRVEAQTGDPADDGEPPVSKPIGQLTTNIRPPEGSLPANAAAKHFPEGVAGEFAERHFAENMFFWEASNLSHQPLRFEQAYVERYGYNYGLLQPVVSGVQFFGDVAALPVKMIVVPGRRSIYTLGTGRPGSYGVSRP